MLWKSPKKKVVLKYLKKWPKPPNMKEMNIKTQIILELKPG